MYADEYASGLIDDPGREVYVSIPKLRHDVAQLGYLAEKGVLLKDLDRMIDSYQRVIGDASTDRAPADRWLITDRERREIGDFYNRIIHRPEAQRVPQALSADWAPGRVEDAYLDGGRKAVVVDNFLSPAALNGLLNFCLESVIWFNNRYAYGRLGTLFSRGFNCPLLVQIGEEIASAFPNILGPKHQLRQLWAYKNGQQQPASPPHADFAAVNVNIWITPDRANLDPSSGGLDIYDVEAPLSWRFEKYNKGGRAIREFLRKSSATVTKVPYHANRAIIFNSDLFHATQQLAFDDGYQNRRINVTLLYGRREEDDHQTAKPAGLDSQ
jgi:hypothetical protein